MSTPDVPSVIAALADRITQGLSTTFEGDGTEDRRAIMDRYSELKMSRSFMESAYQARSEWVQARLTEFWKEVVMNESHAPVPDPDLVQVPIPDLPTPADVETRRELARLTTQVEADKILIAGMADTIGEHSQRRTDARDEYERQREENAAFQFKADMEAASDDPTAPTPAPALAPDPAEPIFPAPGRLYVSCPGCRTQSTRDRGRCPVCGGREFIPARLTTRDVERLKSAHAWEDRVFETVISILNGTGDDQAIARDAELSRCAPVLFAFRVRGRLRIAEAEVERLTREAETASNTENAMLEAINTHQQRHSEARAEIDRLNAAVLEREFQRLFEIVERLKAERDLLRTALINVQKMAERDLERGRGVTGSFIYQIEADAREALRGTS